MLTSIDLFSGAGGLSYGLKEAGFETRFALDSDSNACDTFRANVSQAAVCADLSDYPPARIREITRVAPGDLTLVCGGPPCQGFSVQRRGPQRDVRNDLVTAFGETAVALRPSFILIENVPTLLGPRGKGQMRALASLFNKNGYDYDATVLNAADYGVPQNRRRVFVVAWRRDRVPGFAFPKPKVASPLTVRQAIADLPEPPDDYTEHAQFANHRRVKVSAQNLVRISHVPPGGGRLDLPDELQLPCHRNGNGHRHLDVFGRMRWDAPAPTITAMFDNFTRGRFAHPTENRSITGREGARLQSFPDEFRFSGGKKDVARQIGNAVPPALARHLGEALVRALEGSQSEGEGIQMRLPV